MSDANGKCDDCGRFMRHGAGATWAHKYDFVAMECRYEHYRCAACTERLGPITSNARPHNGDMSPYQGSFSDT
jgi:hypothetical protein